MLLVFDMIALVVGFAAGTAVGYWIGSRFRDDRRFLWALAIAAFLSASILNFAGLLSGTQWLAIGAVGLMAGVISGVKYGGFPETRVWDAGSPGDDGKQKPPAPKS